MTSPEVSMEVGPQVLRLFPPPAAFQRYMMGVQAAVQASLSTHPMRNPTTAELKRRCDLAAGIATKLRGDLGWGVQRVVDHLPEYLRNTLDGIQWSPDARRVWVPSDGQV